VDSPLTTIVLSGTLKRSPAFSHTEVLAQVLLEQLAVYKVGGEIIRLVDYNIKPGVESDEGEGDEWPGILKKVLAADILIFATPIWWGVQSSVLQRVIERMDDLNDELLETGKAELANKVGGIVITGAEDGAQHIIGNLCNFMVWNGLTLPPACSLSWLGDTSGHTPETLKKKFYEQKSTKSMAEVMAQNLVFFARLLKERPLPQAKGGISQHLAPGTVGM